MKVGNRDVTPQALWPTAKSLMKRDATMAIHGPLGITYHPNKGAKEIADCSENRFTCHDLSDQNHEQVVETTVQALLASVQHTQLRN
jgi:hypothetical protein